VARHTRKSRVRRKVIGIGTAAISTLGLAGVAALGFGGSAQAVPTAIRAELRDANGADLGDARLEQQDDGSVLIRLNVAGLTPGFHALHIHTAGKCETDPLLPPGTFNAALGHFNPSGGNHGAHAGDLPVLLADNSGNAYLKLSTTTFQMADLFDPDGSAVVIHAGPDNYANVPPRYVLGTTLASGPDGITLSNGDAGGRIACGVLAQPAAP
jgi:Cu-Zn family superoxide dismutase